MRDAARQPARLCTHRSWDRQNNAEVSVEQNGYVIYRTYVQRVPLK